MTDPVGHLAQFGRELRAEGLPVGTGRVLEFCRAASLLDPPDLYWAGRATLIGRHEEIETYDRVFDRHFRGARARSRPEWPRMRMVTADVEVALASEIELLRSKSFSKCSPDELAQLAALMAKVRFAVATRRSRRRRGARAGEPDFRRTLRRSFRTSGEPVDRLWRERRRRNRRLVLLLDVSGSMADYSRALVLFARAALRADRRWEAFCFGTRLTRVTRQLATGTTDAALRRAAAEVVDWEGGTRIGVSLERFLRDFGGLARGAVVVICSDGLEVGDPEHLRKQMARLALLAHRIVWLNPLQESPEYEPLARGMAAALPYVDVFASGHNLASLEELGSQLG
jgi:uncharacterized protein